MLAVKLGLYTGVTLLSAGPGLLNCFVACADCNYSITEEIMRRNLLASNEPCCCAYKDKDIKMEISLLRCASSAASAYYRLIGYGHLTF